MTYRYDQKLNQIVIDGFQDGISDSPYEGFSDMRNAEIMHDTGEISVAFTSGAVTLPPVFNAVAYTAAASTDRLTVASVTGMYEGCAIVLASNTATGLSNAIVYYVRNISGLTFQVSTRPFAPVIDITVDGTGTLTTYQYGNQRGLTDNGAPVSYFNAPEIGGVLLLDSSNYAWLWQQGDDGASPINTVTFLGNIGGIATNTSNQNGIAYWEGAVVLIEQGTYLNVMIWENFTTTVTLTTSLWTNTFQYPEVETLTVDFDGSTDYESIFINFASASNAVPTVVIDDYVEGAASATTITSSSISVLAGDTVFVWAVNYNNQAVSSATFNGSAMTSVTNATDTTPFDNGYRILYYTVPSDMTATAVATYGASVANRFMHTVVVRGVSPTSNNVFTEDGTAVTIGVQGMYRTRSSDLGLWLIYNDSNTVNIAPTGSLLLRGGSSTGTSAITGKNALYQYSNMFGEETTLRKNVPVVVGDDNVLYWASGANNIASLTVNAGETFDLSLARSITSSGSSYTLSGYSYVINLSALDLPVGERVESLQMSSSTLFAGADSKRIYPWDTISPSFDQPVSFPEAGVVDFVATNNLLYAFGGNQGRIHLTNESSASLYRELPDSITGTERAFYFFWDANVGNSELYFAFQAYTNDDPTTALTTTSGVWAINSDTNAFRMVQGTLNANSWVRMVNPVSDGYTQEFLRPPGQGLLVGYSVGSNYYLDYSTSVPSTDYSCYFETEIIPVGTNFDKQTFQHIEYKLGVPMVSGEGIRVSQRSNLNSAYTVIAEFTTAGLISDQSSINWENVEWVQFKVEMKSVVSNPSYTRLRELRLR